MTDQTYADLAYALCCCNSRIIASEKIKTYHTDNTISYHVRNCEYLKMCAQKILSKNAQARGEVAPEPIHHPTSRLLSATNASKKRRTDIQDMQDEQDKGPVRCNCKKIPNWKQRGAVIQIPKPRGPPSSHSQNCSYALAMARFEEKPKSTVGSTIAKRARATKKDNSVSVMRYVLIKPNRDGSSSQSYSNSSNLLPIESSSAIQIASPFVHPSPRSAGIEMGSGTSSSPRKVKDPFALPACTNCKRAKAKV